MIICRIVNKFERICYDVDFVIICYRKVVIDLKLNPDCVRNILLTVEEIADCSTIVRFKHGNMSQYEKLSEFAEDEVFYHIEQCNLSGFFVQASKNIIGDYTIIDLSPKGHEFIANIRKDNVWGGVKTVSKKIGATSLSALTQIASNVITELIKAQFGLSGAPIL